MGISRRDQNSPQRLRNCSKRNKLKIHSRKIEWALNQDSPKVTEETGRKWRTMQGRKNHNSQSNKCQILNYCALLNQSISLKNHKRLSSFSSLPYGSFVGRIWVGHFVWNWGKMNVGLNAFMCQHMSCLDTLIYESCFNLWGEGTALSFSLNSGDNEMMMNHC